MTVLPKVTPILHNPAMFQTKTRMIVMIIIMITIITMTRAMIMVIARERAPMKARKRKKVPLLTWVTLNMRATSSPAISTSI